MEMVVGIQDYDFNELKKVKHFEHMLLQLYTIIYNYIQLYSLSRYLQVQKCVHTKLQFSLLANFFYNYCTVYSFVSHVL